jgi:hypothetical protein
VNSTTYLAVLLKQEEEAAGLVLEQLEVQGPVANELVVVEQQGPEEQQEQKHEVQEQQ